MMFQIQRAFNRLGGLHVSDPGYENKTQQKNKVWKPVLYITPQYFADIIEHKCKISIECKNQVWEYWEETAY